MTQETLNKTLVALLRDLYDAEKQLVKALPKMAKAADNEDLVEAIRSHLTETETHVTRLEEVFGIIGAPAKGKPCKGMKGLLEEGNEAMQEEDKGEMRDLAMIAGAQKVEHYEISAYGTLRTLAEQLDLGDAVELLQQTEDEEKAADSKLTEIAVMIYESAMSAEDDEDEEGAEEEEEQPARTTAGKSKVEGGKTRTAR
ncbi:MAG: ferritin-like domain-containing protein [Candidatus Solibacter sp.]